MERSSCIDLLSAEQARLLGVARESIAYGLDAGQPLQCPAEGLGGALGARLASFVTLRKRSALRGCVGSLRAVRPLIQDVASSAFNAAFRDPRFAPMDRHELDLTRVEISVLTPMEPLDVKTDRQLLDALIPFEDGLLLEDEGHRATFLPKVWDSLPSPPDFVRALKLKAGLTPDGPIHMLNIYRYRTVSFSEASTVTD